ncbi:MAG: PAS domain S-box-containing protein, partial [Granulosicoccus sp.]
MKNIGSSSVNQELAATVLLRQFNLSSKDLQLIRSFAKISELDTKLLVDDFYVWLQSEDWFKSFFPTGIVMSIKDLQSEYWAEFTRAEVDDAYVTRRVELGNVHAVINLPVSAYIAGMNFVQSWFERTLKSSSLSAAKSEKTGAAVSRLIQLDTSIVMHAYSARSSKQIKETDMLQKAVMNASLDPMLTIDEVGTVQFVSSSIEKVFGWLPEEIIGKNIRMLMPDPYHSEHDSYLSNYKNTGKSKIMGAARTLRAVRKNGEEFDCEISVAKVDAGDSAAPLFTGVIRDVTERMVFENRVTEIHSILQSVATGNLSQQIIVDGEDDKLGQAVFSVVESFQEVVTQADSIGMGNFNVELKLRGESDQLRLELITMNDMLRNVANQANTIA